MIVADLQLLGAEYWSTTTLGGDVDDLAYLALAVKRVQQQSRPAQGGLAAAQVAGRRRRDYRHHGGVRDHWLDGWLLLQGLYRRLVQTTLALYWDAARARMILPLAKLPHVMFFAAASNTNSATNSSAQLTARIETPSDNRSRLQERAGLQSEPVHASR